MSGMVTVRVKSDVDEEVPVAPEHRAAPVPFIPR